MRDSTRTKLFDTIGRFNHCARYRALWEVDTDVGFMTLLHIPYSGLNVIVHEFNREADGFEVYAQTRGNTVNDSQRAMGFHLKEDEPEMECEESDHASMVIRDIIVEQFSRDLNDQEIVLKKALEIVRKMKAQS